MINNTMLLQELFSRNQIALENAPFLKTSPAPLPEGWDFECVEGMLLGLAIGDALGFTTEALLPHERHKRYGEIRDYLPNRYANNQEFGTPSDDTQMAFWMLENALSDGGLVPDHLANEYTKHELYGIGSTVRDFIRAYKKYGVPWDQAGQPSAGNGVVMRIAPVLIPHLRQPSPALWADAVIAGMITHNDRASNACSVAFVHLLWECLRLQQIPDPIWWIDTFSAVASKLEGNTHYRSRVTEFPYEGTHWQFIDREVRKALNEDWSVLYACERWHSGAYLLETMPCVLYILSRYENDPEEAIVRAVNDTKDNDTVAAIVGAAVGALHGRKGLPERWIKNLLGRTEADDDGRVFELINEARKVFWEEGK